MGNTTTPITAMPPGTPSSDWLIPAIGYDIASQIWRPYKIALGALPSVGASYPGAREIVTTNRTYYVYEPTGSDLNTGRTLLDPFKTIQHAYDAIRNFLDMPYGIKVTIQLIDGTYTKGLLADERHVGGGKVVIKGNYANPGNVIVIDSALEATFVAYDGATITVKDMELRSTSQHDLYAKWHGIIHYNNIRFGTAGVGHKTVSFHGTILADGEDLTAIPPETRKNQIVGDALYHVYAHNGAIRDEGSAFTLVGSRTFTTFFFVPGWGTANYYGSTYTGPAVTGKKFEAAGGVIAGDQNLAFLPGSIPGTCRNGGTYSGLTAADILLSAVEVNNIGAVSTDGLLIWNSTAATAGVQQNAPRLRRRGFGWSTLSLASQPVDFYDEIQVTSGNPSPTGRWLWNYSVNGGAVVALMGLGQTGFLNVIGGYTVNGVLLSDLLVPQTAAAAKAANYTAVAADNNGFFLCTGTWTLGLTAAATLGAAWQLRLRNSGSGLITIDPNGAETIDGVASFKVYPGECFEIRCDGTSFYSVGRGDSDWVAYTPSSIVAATPGSPAAVFTPSNCKYMITKGRSVTLTGNVTVTSQGVGASGGILIANPTGLPAAAASGFGVCDEYSATGKTGVAFANITTSIVALYGSKTDAGGTTLIITGYVIGFSVKFEIPLQ